MKLRVLVDNYTYTDQYYGAEPALCYYIEDGGVKLLFDTGYSELFIKNAEAFGIHLSQISTVVLSHGHDDHTRGLPYFIERYGNASLKIIAHPEAFYPKRLGEMMIGSPLTEIQLRGKSELILSKEPVQISARLMFLGEIPRTHTFEHQGAIGMQNPGDGWREDFLADDSALVYQAAGGIYIITGCSHSGICNIISHAKAVCGVSKVLGVIGGFHLFGRSLKLKQTIKYFQEHRIRDLFPCHCVDFEAKAEIHKSIPIHEVGVGLELEW